MRVGRTRSQAPDVDGLYRRYAGGCGEDLIDEVSPADDVTAVIGRKGSRLGRGGMSTKLRAARLLMACGEMTVIAHARRHRLGDIIAGAE